MKFSSRLFLLGILIVPFAEAATLYVDLQSPGPFPPYSSWNTAATNIQVAIDAAAPGDLVLVTNGVYDAGGKAMSGDLTNRVSIDKAITIRSVNGWPVTVIQGAKDPATNGPTAVRCAWLTNGALLDGFTLRDGATRSTGDQFTLRSGGGVWAASTNANITNCQIENNDAHYGGGAFRGWFEGCTFQRNVAQADGGGGYSNFFFRCYVLENIARVNGGGLASGWGRFSIFKDNAAALGGGVHGAGSLVNCTLTFNRGNTFGGTYSTGTGWMMTNCLIWANSPQNNSGGNFRNTCTTPLPSGTGNLAVDPLLLMDGIHIASNSPCRSVGLPVGGGLDLDGQPFEPAPAMGCDEWRLDPVASKTKLQFDSWGRVRLSAFGIGQTPFTYRWEKNGLTLTDGGSISGAGTPDVVIMPPSGNDAGLYRLIVSNASGVTTGLVTRLGFHFVDVRNETATAPFNTWATAANTLEDAATISRAGSVIVVAPGVYGRGGRAMSGDLTNRVTLKEAVALISRDGPETAVIQGAWDYTTTNGPTAVRGVWMGDGSTLAGFTVRGGATRGTIGDFVNLQAGGGIWCNSTNALIIGCVIERNSAGGGGGGGVFRGTCHNSLIQRNQSSGLGVGALFTTLKNVTVVNNFSLNNFSTAGAGTASNLVYNSIVWGNTRFNASGLQEYYGSIFTNSCTRPLPAGAGNISVEPSFEPDGFHLPMTAALTNSGSSAWALGFDIDNQPWSNSPAIGCDQPSSLPAANPPRLIASGDGKIRLRATVVGATPASYAWHKDGVTLANDANTAGADTAEISISNFGPANGGDYRVSISNSFGVITTSVVTVRAKFVNAANPTPQPPFTNWTSAASSIQTAIDAADYGDLIVVADGNYNTGGRVGFGLTNRVSLEKAIVVSSLNGPMSTIIEGQKDPSGPRGNGDNAVRSVWLENGTTLAGFTIRGGATRTNGNATLLQSGGGVWSISDHAIIQGCIVTDNDACQNGGGAFGGRFDRCNFVGNTATNGGGLFGGTASRCFFTENTAHAAGAPAGGGGAASATLYNSAIHKNHAPLNNPITKVGGASSCNLLSCTVTENDGNGIFLGFVFNTISWGNGTRDYAGSVTMNYSCASFNSADYGANNLYTDPRLVDPFHLAIDSPCRSAGSQLYLTETDWDGDAWGSPAPIGVDAFNAAAITGPLTVSIELPPGPIYPNRTLPFVGRVGGRAERVAWDFGGGIPITNLSYATSRSWPAPGVYPVTFTAYNQSYPLGTSATSLVEVVAVPAPSWGSIENVGFKRFSINTAVGVTNHIEYTTNLAPPVVWMPLKTSVATNALMYEADFASTNAARFYRMRSE